jgi:hypothetical protein
MIETHDKVRRRVGITRPGVGTTLGHGGTDPDDEPISLG